MAIQNEPTRIQIPFADSGTKNVIPDTNSTPSASQAASWTDGFPAQCSLPLSAGGIPPARADFNGILNTMTQSERFTQEGGVWAWDATVDYGTNRLVLGSDGKLYWSVAQSGPNVGGAQDPTLDILQTYWSKVSTNDSNVVHKTGSETIAGYKTFTSDIKLSSPNNPAIIIVRPDYERKTTPSNTVSWGYNFRDKNNTMQAYLISQVSTSRSAYIVFGTFSGVDDTEILVTLAYESSGDKELYPSDNGGTYLGIAAHKWKQLYASTSTISTSDERLKSTITNVPDDILDAWSEVDFVQFKFNDAIDKKGEKARIHNGLIAQRVDEVFKSHGLDAASYGLFCFDKWDAQEETRDKDGNIVTPAREAGDCYSLRYEEALCMEASYQRRRADRAEARLAALEERLAAIEAKLG